MTKVEIFSGQNCSYCQSAISLLKRRGITYTDYDISTDTVHREEFVRRLPRVRSIPQIFIDGEHVGGYDDLELLDTSGRLAALVNP
jgi:glutaredoxin 3